MFFKNLQIFRMTKQWQLTAEQLEFALACGAYAPIGATQTVNHGWIHTTNDAFVRNIDGQLLITLKSETKKVPTSAVKAALAEKIAEMVDQTGRKPGKKEKREITDDIVLTLLPRVIPTESRTLVWIDTKGGWIVVDSASKGKSDTAITQLIRALDKLQLETLYLARDAGTVLTEWLQNDSSPLSFSIDRACELQACDESKAKVKYSNADLITDDVQTHIKQGKRVVKMALTWNDRVSFVLTSDFRVRSIKALDVVYEGHNADDHEDAQATDFVLMTGELRKLLAELIQAFGGESEREAE